MQHHKRLYKQLMKAALMCVSKVAPPSGQSRATKPLASLSHAHCSLPAAALELAIYYSEAAADRSD